MKKLIAILFLVIFITGCQTGVIVEPPEKPKLPERTGDYGGAEKVADVLIIIAQDGFQPVEYEDTREQIENAGFEVNVASLTRNNAIGSDGSEVKPDLAIEYANAADYKAVVVIGGPGAPELGENDNVLKLLKDADEQGKVVAAICIAPTVAAKAGVLQGKKATVWYDSDDRSPIDAIKLQGAEFVDEAVVVDGNIITANGPAAAEEFGKKIAEALK